MRLNVTTIRDALKCPQYAHNLHIKRRGPLHTPVSLDVGTLFHQGMELRMADGKVVAHELPSWGDVSQEARDVFMKHKLWVPLNGFAPDPAWEVHGIEMRVSRAISQNLLLEGRLDGFIVWNGKLWSAQWKTYSGDGLADLQERVRLSWHEVAYQWMAEGPDMPWGGTILGACQKLPGYRLIESPDGGSKKTRQEVTDFQREAAFTLHFLTRSPEQQAEMVQHLIITAQKVQYELERQIPVLKNYDQCFGKFGGRCPFFEVCHEQLSLYDPSFRDMEDRYSDVARIEVEGT